MVGVPMSFFAKVYDDSPVFKPSIGHLLSLFCNGFRQFPVPRHSAQNTVLKTRGGWSFRGPVVKKPTSHGGYPKLARWMVFLRETPKPTWKMI